MSARDWSAPRWVNTEPDTGAVGALLHRLGRHVAPATVDELWLFPTRRGGSIESTVFVLATFTDDPGRRDVLTARFTVTRDRKGRATVDESIDAHATAPATALARVVDGVLRRLGDDAAHPPRLEHIAGDEAKWTDLVVELGGVIEQETAPADAADAADPPAPTAADEPGAPAAATDAAATGEPAADTTTTMAHPAPSPTPDPTGHRDGDPPATPVGRD